MGSRKVFIWNGKPSKASMFDIRVNPMTLRQLLGLCDARREIGNDEFVCAIDLTCPRYTLTSLPD